MDINACFSIILFGSWQSAGIFFLFEVKWTVKKKPSVLMGLTDMSIGGLENRWNHCGKDQNRINKGP